MERVRDNLELRSMSNVKDSELMTKYLYGEGPEGYTEVSVFEAKHSEWAIHPSISLI